MIRIKALREKIAWRTTAPSMFLVINSFVWYIFASNAFSTIVNGLGTGKLELFTAFYVSIALSAVLGAKFFPRVQNKCLILWLVMGVVSTILLPLISSSTVLIGAVIAFFLGTSIGIGLPSCLSHFADSTSVENRGLIGGIIWSSLGVAVLLFAFLLNPLGIWDTILFLTIWRLFGAIGFPVLNRNHHKPILEKAPSFLKIIRKRQILLYLFPWVMFSIINFAEVPILENVFGSDAFTFGQIVEWVFIGIFAIIGGTIADRAGRKRVVIAGFAMLGIEYAAMSTLFTSPQSLYLFLTLDGVTWGLLFSVFFMALWGDLGENYEKEKFYALGGLPYLLSNFLYVLIKPVASGISAMAAFSFASFFLFVAVIPLMYAPETLPEKSMKDRDLKSYLEKAQKIVQKEKEKNQEIGKKSEDKTEASSEKGKEETDKDYEEARKLAEKYY